MRFPYAEIPYGRPRPSVTSRKKEDWKQYLPGGTFWQNASPAMAAEVAVLLAFTIFFIFYGLVPIFGGNILGLVGADEPRYAQIAREMLARHDYITPILYGRPWLEKPALYYWRAMFAFKEFGVHDWSARLPSASFTFGLILLIYLHMRRFRPGAQLDAALITVSCAGIIGFARGASTDMQLAAPFCIGMLGWYAWYETDRKFWLFDLYFFVGAATLAKGPVAPGMALCIIFVFAALRREWSLLRRTIWWPGIILYLAMVLPWFIAVQHRNPEFLRVFFLEHNLERFATDRFRHDQPIWYYLPVMLIALLPWTVVAMNALGDAIRDSIDEWKVRRAPDRYVGNPRAGDAFPEFLVLWAFFPIIFFTFSQSKLPGYVLPSIPRITILTGDYLNRVRTRGLHPWLLTAHAMMVGMLVAAGLMLPHILVLPHHVPPVPVIVSACMIGAAFTIAILVVVVRFGTERLRIATMIPVVLVLIFLLGTRNGTVLNKMYSSRNLAGEIAKIQDAPPQVCIYKARRDVQYGLGFYRNQRVQNYDTDGIPLQAHILVVRTSAIPNLRNLLIGRDYEPLFAYPAQGLTIYRVYAQK